ncbi:MAG: thioredoxin family protein [Chloroflexota bacterium]
MLSIKVLGPGCPNCERLRAATMQAVMMLGAGGRVEHVTDPAEFRAYRLLATPGLVVNGKLVCAGRVPEATEIVSMLATALAEAESS